MAATVVNTSGEVNNKTLCLEESIATVTAAWVFEGIANTGLRVLDTDASHALSLVPGSNLTAARTLTITTGDADRTLTLGASVSLDQDVTIASSPTFAGVTAGSLTLSNAALGTGNVTGRVATIGRNSSGSGAAGVLNLVSAAGTSYFLWVDATGDLRIGTSAPHEDGTPSDTSGTVVGTQT